MDPALQEVTGHLFDSCKSVFPSWIITLVDLSSMDTFILMTSRATSLFLNRSLWFIVERVHVMLLKDKWHLTSGSTAFNLFHCSFLFLKTVTRTLLFSCFSNSSHLRHLFLSAFLLLQTYIFLCAQSNWLLLHTHFFSSMILTVLGSTWLPPDPIAHWTEKIHQCCLYRYFSCLSSRVFSLFTLADKKHCRSLNLREVSEKPYFHKQVLHISEMLTSSS